jgi:exo-beta-1,3-glucanase (GH17 family)
MDSVDGVAYHPYSFPDLPSHSTGSNGFIDQLADVRKVMVAHGDADKKVWLTEFGYPTLGGGHDVLNRQKQAVIDGFDTWRSLSYVGPFFWFSWRDPDAGSSNLQHNFGLLRADDSLKPAFTVFAQELRR